MTGQSRPVFYCGLTLTGLILAVTFLARTTTPGGTAVAAVLVLTGSVQLVARVVALLTVRDRERVARLLFGPDR